MIQNRNACACSGIGNQAYQMQPSNRRYTDEAIGGFSLKKLAKNVKKHVVQPVVKQGKKLVDLQIKIAKAPVDFAMKAGKAARRLVKKVPGLTDVIPGGNIIDSLDPILDRTLDRWSGNADPRTVPYLNDTSGGAGAAPMQAGGMDMTTVAVVGGGLLAVILFLKK